MSQIYSKRAAEPTTNAVTAASTLDNDTLIRGDGGARGVQDSVVTLTDAGVMSGITQLDVDNLRIDGNTISSTDTDGDIVLSPDGTGNVSIPNGYVLADGQAAFFAYAGANQAAATGDGTNYPVQFSTEVYDVTTSFDGTTFTAPVAGIYTLTAGVYLSNLDSGHTALSLIFDLASPAATYYGTLLNPFAISVSGVVMLNMTHQIKLAASQTVTVVLTVTGGTKTVQVDNTAIGTYFGATLLAATGG